MARCMNPFILRDEATENEMPVPCGRCPACVSTRISQWTFRLQSQYNDMSTTSAHFVTLTYDPKYVPYTKNGFKNLDYRDLQLFFKRLRKLKSGSNESTIKYFAVGEYGGKTKRPHYHVILFNSDPGSVMRCWRLGNCHFGEVTAASIGYCFKYLNKPMRKPDHERDDRVRERSFCSKGLGKCYLTEAIVAWHRSSDDNAMVLRTEEGKRVSMPRYFKDRIYSKDEREEIGYRTNIEAQAEIDAEIERIGIDEYLRLKRELYAYKLSKARQSGNSGGVI